MINIIYGILIGIYITGVIINAFMKGMGGEGKGPSSFLWPYYFIKGYILK